jgi:hypothetical protein
MIIVTPDATLIGPVYIPDYLMSRLHTIRGYDEAATRTNAVGTSSREGLRAYFLDRQVVTIEA